MVPSGNTQRAPAGRLTWPTVSDASKSGPAAPGPSQSVWSRAQSQTQAVAGLSGSGVAFALNVAQPQDQIAAILNSWATCFAASASSFTTSNQADAGSRPPRAPRPGEELNWSWSAPRPEGTPICVSLLTRPRSPARIVRLAASAPIAEKPF